MPHEGRVAGPALCCWCDEPATVYLLPDSPTLKLDTACPVHAQMWAGLYRRIVKLAPEIVVDLRSAEVPVASGPDLTEHSHGTQHS